jgi:hypothetical protein
MMMMNDLNCILHITYLDNWFHLYFLHWLLAHVVIEQVLQ